MTSVQVWEGDGVRLKDKGKYLVSYKLSNSDVTLYGKLLDGEEDWEQCFNPHAMTRDEADRLIPMIERTSDSLIDLDEDYHYENIHVERY